MMVLMTDVEVHCRTLVFTFTSTIDLAGALGSMAGSLHRVMELFETMQALEGPREGLQEVCLTKSLTVFAWS